MTVPVDTIVTSFKDTLTAPSYGRLSATSATQHREVTFASRPINLDEMIADRISQAQMSPGEPFESLARLFELVVEPVVSTAAVLEARPTTTQVKITPRPDWRREVAAASTHEER